MIQATSADRRIRGGGMSKLKLVGCALLLAQLPPPASGKCPNWCSQSGVCTGPGDDSFCICEMGYQGDDCATRMCPKGDDPLTTGQADRAVMLRTTAEGGRMGGEVNLTFNGETTSFDANAHRTGDHECVSALQALPNIERVSCKRGPVSDFGGAEYVISILSFPTMPWENNHYSNSGNPPLESFSCDIFAGEGETGDLASPSCELIDIVAENTKEYTECSRHGICVRETGRCECSFGFKGDACDDISDSDDAQVIIAEGPFFTGSALKLRANRGFSPDFDLIKAIAGSHDLMTLTGMGDLILHEGALFIQPQQSFKIAPWQEEIPPRALLVSGGSLGVRGGGAEISSTRANTPGLAVSVGLSDPFDGGGGPSAGGFHTQGGDVSFSYSGVALSVNVKETAERAERSPDRFRLLELSVGGGGEHEERGGDAEVLLSVRGDGRVWMAGGGGVVLGEGDLEVSQGGATFQGSASVGHSLAVGPGGVAVTDGGSIRVLDGGFEARTTTSSTAAPARLSESYGSKKADAEERVGDRGSSGTAVGVLSASHRDFSGDVLRIDAGGAGAADAGAILVRASAGGKDVFEIQATGATTVKAGGLDVETGGLRVGSGGVSVDSGGLSVSGGLRLRSGTLVIDDSSGGGSGGGKSGGFEVAHGGVRAASSDASTPALTASANGHGFGATVFSVSAPASSPSKSFRLMQASVGGGLNTDIYDQSPGAQSPNIGDQEQVVFAVDGTGRVTAAGGLETHEGGHAVVGGRLTSKGPTVLERRRATRDLQGGVEVDASVGTFFEVPDDGVAGSANVLRIKGEATPGQVLVLRNGDGDSTSGAATIPPRYTVLFIHDGNSWRDIRVLEATVTELRGVTSMVAANDLDIGDFTLKARHLVSTGTDAGGVAVFGGGGVLTSDKRLSWDSASGTLTVPRLHALEVAEGMDFKGKPARNVALVNATIDRIPFLKTARLMVETAVAKNSDGAISSLLSGPELGLAVFDKKGEISRAEGVVARPGGLLEVKEMGPHAQAGDIDFQGYAARNLSLSGVSSITGLDILEVRGVFLRPPSEASTALSTADLTSIEGGAGLVIASGGELRSVGEAFSVEAVTGTLLAPRIGPHEVTGDVDVLGNTVRNAVLENPHVRGTVPRLHTSALSVSVHPSVSRGFLAVFSSPEDYDAGAGLNGEGPGKLLGQAAGGGGLAWRDGALQDVRLGGATTMEGDLDMGGHRLLNFDMEGPDLDRLEELTIHRSLTLGHHASARGALLAVGIGGVVTPADPTTLSLDASSASISGRITSNELSCRGSAEIGGDVSITGGATVKGEVELGGGMDARGTRIANAYLENVGFRGAVDGDVAFDGGVNVGALKNEGGGIVAAGASGELTVVPGVKYDKDAAVLVIGKLSGHEVTGDVDFGGHAVLSPTLDFSAGGGLNGLPTLSVGSGGIEVAGLLQTASDVVVDGSITVSGAVMGRGPYMDTSDGRLKTDVEEISATEASSVVRALRAVTYVLKPDAFPSSKIRDSQQAGRRQHGFIAQELEAVAPELVSEDSRGFKVVAYSRLVPILTSALATTLDRLDKLESSIATGSASNDSVPSTVPPPSSGSDAAAGDRTGFRSGGDTSVATNCGPASAGTRTRNVKSPVDGQADAWSPAEQAGTLKVVTGDAASVRLRRGAASLGSAGPEVEELAVFDQMQLWVENTALRVKVDELEEKMRDVERNMEIIFGVAT